MQIELSTHPSERISSDVVLVFAFQEKKNKKPTFVLLNDALRIDKLLKGQLVKTLEVEGFTGALFETATIHATTPIVPTRIIVLGLGEKKSVTSAHLRNTVGKLSMQMRVKIDSISLSLPELDLNQETMTQVVSEGFLLGTYDFGKYKSDEKPNHTLQTLIISSPDAAKLQKTVKKAQTYAKATILARDLVNEPAIEMTPTALATVAKDIARKNPDITCKVFNKAEAEKLGMHAFLGIARASDTPPQFIYLHYKPKKVKNKEIVALVGKGITFDTGGINVKPEQYMTTMKEDMAGAAAVIATFSVISEVAPSCEVLGLVAATPNMISGSSIVPGDVVKALNGKTIEIQNTDAEGRVTLADSLSFAVSKKATTIVDLATLTGASMVGLGTDIASLFSNDEELTKKLENASMSAGEKLWEMPLEKDYIELNKSDVADISNVGSSRYGGAITAALFLQEFIGNTKWAHLDIAGPAFPEKHTAIGPKGGSGFGVRTLLNFLSENYA